MHDPLLICSSIVAVIAAAARKVTAPGAGGDEAESARIDRGAVSIEQVLWYAAAAVSVAIVAAIIWSQIRDTASTPVQSPSAP